MSKLTEKKAELAQLTAYGETLYAKSRETGLIDDEKRELDKVLERAESVATEIKSLEEEEALSRKIASIGRDTLGPAEAKGEAEPEYKDVIDAFLKSDRFRAVAETKSRPSGWKVDPVEYKTVYALSDYADSDVQHLRPGIISQDFLQPTTVGALFTQATMDGSSVSWMTSVVDADGDYVDIGQDKTSTSSVALDVTDTRARKIAATFIAPEESLDDLPALEGMLRAALLNGPNGLAQKAENAYINGDASSNEIQGVLDLTPDDVSDEDRTSKNIFKAALSIQSETAMVADAYVYNPSDAFALFTEEDDNKRPLWGPFGSFYSLPGQPMRAVASAAVPPGTIIVGRFASSIRFVRRTASVRASSEGLGLADHNLVLFVAEMREALVHPYDKAPYRTVTVGS